MAKMKVIYDIGNPIFLYKNNGNIGYSSDSALNEFCFEMDLFLDYLQHTTKIDVLLSFEYVFLKIIDKEFLQDMN